jgi:trehalose/maltose transport system substrate-binding protein
MMGRDYRFAFVERAGMVPHENSCRGWQMKTPVVAIRKWKLVLGYINRTTCWWALAVAILVILIAFELAGFNDGKGLRASEHWVPVLAPAPVATTVSDFQIKEWPRNLRTDLKGTSIKVVLPENEPDRPWDDALMAKFREVTGIEVQAIRPGNDTSAVLSSYLREFAAGSPQADVYAIDIVWPGILSDYAEDLRPVFGEVRDMVPSLVRNDTVHGKLVAVPYFVEISLLYYRRDLLEKYHFAQPPRSWNELEHQARVIMDGERANGGNTFWGFLWQGAASEALTCNALEWQISQGGGWLLKPDGRVSLERASLVQAFERARRWIGTVSPPDVTDQLEDDSLRIWKNGDAAFMRNWPYAYVESMRPDSSVRNQVGVTLLPKGDHPGARHADVLGGFQLMVSKKSANKGAAIELVKFLTSPEIQRVNAATRGYAPTRPALYDSPALKANPFFATLRNVLLNGAVTRPSTAAGAKYDRLSTAYFTAVRQTLTGEKSADAAVSELESELHRLTAKYGQFEQDGCVRI